MNDRHVEFAAARFLIVGTCRDCAHSLPSTINALTGAFAGSRQVDVHVVESDSRDRTVQVLQQLSEQLESFSYVSLGALAPRFPLRTQRLAHCRNHGLAALDRSPSGSRYDYVVVADLDGVNDQLASHHVHSCWRRRDWDVCCANQAGPYYDIWALRHPAWSPNDCWQQQRFLRSHGLSSDAATAAALLARMITIAPQAAWIEVDSAFGGLAIYRAVCLSDVHYEGLDDQGHEVCEHVSVHAQIRARGGRLFINPALINAGFVNDAWRLQGLGRLRSRLGSHLRDRLSAAGLLPAARAIRHSTVTLLARLRG